MPQDLTKGDILRLLVNGEPDVRARFVKEFQHDIEAFAEGIVRVSQQLKDFRDFATEHPQGTRSVFVFDYLLAALNALLISFHLLISGYTIPARHLIRQFGECVAMALLLSHPEINTFASSIRRRGNTQSRTP